MATVTATNGETFFLWPLPEGSARGISPGIEFNDVTNELGNGYVAQELYGSETGLKRWDITQNTLGGDDFPLPFVTGVTGEEVSQAKALWGLFCHQKRTGKPFAYTCPRDGNTYLVRIDDPKFQIDKEFRADQWSGKVSITQVREDGVTIFDLDDYVFRAPFNITHVRESGHSSPNWINTKDGTNGFVAGGTVTFGSNAQNGHNTVRLNGTSGYLGSGGWSGATCDIIIAMKVRSTTFPGNSGLVAKSTSADIIKGTSGGTKWQNPSLTDFEYRLNGTQYAVTDMQAPMNVFGVCHFRATSTNYMDLSSSPIFGRSISSAFGAYDIGEIVVAYGGPLPYDDAALIVEHLCVKWKVNT